MEVYLDNSATTMSYPEVGELVYKVMCRDYGNPASMHRKGVEAEHYIREAKETLAKILKVNAKEIFFTSGGTESDNLALIGCARANKRSGNHLITTSIEHPAILNTMRYLEEEEGFRVTYLPVDSKGKVKLDALKEALCPETILVSIMYVNNEVGTVQPVEEAAKIVKNIILPSCSTQMRCRDSENTISIRNAWGSICSLPAAIRSTDRRASDFCISEIK